MYIVPGETVRVRRGNERGVVVVRQLVFEHLLPGDDIAVKTLIH